MSDVTALLERCRALGVTLIPLDGRLRMRAPQPLPDDLIAELRSAKGEILIQLQRQLRSESECWFLEEWRRVSIPEWRQVLQKSITARNTSREEYARWMLREVLDDPEYREEQ